MKPNGYRATLTGVTLENFKSYRKSVLPITPLTVLIGANASGKSNAIEGLRFIHEIASGRYLDDVYKDLHELGTLRGPRTALTWQPEQPFSIEVAARIHPEEADRAEMQWTIHVSTLPELLICTETLVFDAETVATYQAKARENAPPHTLTVIYNNFARGGKKPHLWADDRQPVFAQLNTPAAFTTPAAAREIPRRVEALRDVLSRIHFLEPRPVRMRGYAPIEMDVRLTSDGRNVSAVLFDICVQQGKKEAVLDFIRELPEGEIVDLDFIKTERNDVMLRITEKFGDREQRWDAAMLSDGTLRVLAVVAALLSAPEGSLVIIEEIDNGVHPSRAHMLINKMQAIIQDRSIRVLLTTHNPALLDALPLQLYPDVVYCYRDARHGDSRFIRLAELHNYPTLMVRDSLGALLAGRVIEKAVREQASPEDRKERNLQWLQAWAEG